MQAFLTAFVFGLAILCSFAGWGWLVLRVCRSRFPSGPGLQAALGLALSTIVGGVLNLLHSVTPLADRIYLASGLLLFIAAFLSGRARMRNAMQTARAYFGPHRVVLAGVLLVGLVALDKYATAVSPGFFHQQDDNHAYLVFPTKMIETGSLGADPFSERRLISSLGGEPFLDTFPLSLTSEPRNLHLMDVGLAYLILLLLLAEIAVRKRVAAHWTVLILLSAALFPAPVSNITALYGPVVLLLMLYDYFDREATRPSVQEPIFLAIALAGLSSLKTSFAPSAGLFFVAFYSFQLLRLPSRRKTLVRAAMCALLVVVFLAPWMWYSRQVSGTLFYPLLGKGVHGSQYGIYLLPTSHLGLRNLLAFLHSSANTVCAILAIQAVLLWAARRWMDRDWLIEAAVVLNALIAFVVIGVGTGGVQVYRYGFAAIFPAVLFLLVKQISSAKESTAPRFIPYLQNGAIPVLLLGLLLGTAWDGFMTEQADWRLTALNFSLRGENIVSPAEISAYRRLQDAIPPHQTILVRLDKNYLLDFRRNPIYVDDLPGGASLPPGVPVYRGPEALAQYFLDHGIRYVAYSYGDEATFSRSEFGDRLKPNVNVWLRIGAQIAFDLQDNLSALGKTRKKLFDNGHMFALDLAVTADEEPKLWSSTQTSSRADRRPGCVPASEGEPE